MQFDFIDGLFVLMLATFIGLDVIRRVSRLLHTPLMSLTNAISAIAVVGAILLAGEQESGLSTVLGAIAVFASTTNIVSGFLITDRMLKMFKKREPAARAGCRAGRSDRSAHPAGLSRRAIRDFFVACFGSGWSCCLHAADVIGEITRARSAERRVPSTRVSQFLALSPVRGSRGQTATSGSWILEGDEDSSQHIAREVCIKTVSGAPQPVPQPRLCQPQTRRGARHQHERHLRGIRVQVRVGAEADRRVLTPELLEDRGDPVLGGVEGDLRPLDRTEAPATSTRGTWRASQPGPRAAHRRGEAGNQEHHQSRSPAARRRPERWSGGGDSLICPRVVPKEPPRHVWVDVHVTKESGRHGIAGDVVGVKPRPPQTNSRSARSPAMRSTGRSDDSRRGRRPPGAATPRGPSAPRTTRTRSR